MPRPTPDQVATVLFLLALLSALSAAWCDAFDLEALARAFARSALLFFVAAGLTLATTPTKL